MKKTIKIEDMSFEVRLQAFSEEWQALMKKWHIAVKEQPFIKEGKIEAEIKAYDLLTKTEENGK